MPKPSRSAALRGIATMYKLAAERVTELEAKYRSPAHSLRRQLKATRTTVRRLVKENL